ncbi:MAG: phosphonopyruvate decarboxylase [Candidatus Marinimicrobia bacterium]|nr:phosphonopyruvate decarboxylase [Candidatus Neomarinimicrobiota bacterium]
MGISPEQFFVELKNQDIKFFTGVPDSLLKQLCLCIDDNVDSTHHIIAANEGNAMGLAVGYHLGTGKIPLVYMQNSGIGNMVNPLLSLCDPEVYSIPMLIVIGWRGEPGVKDEPQHVKQGKVQTALLRSLDIPFEIIDNKEKNFKIKITRGVEIAKKENRPFALIVRKGTFDTFNKAISLKKDSPFLREEVLIKLLGQFPENAIIVSTTGKTSREIFEIREKNGQTHNKDFLTVGSMGHCSSIAMGIALSNPKRKVICIDGDGALIMHMGSLATAGKLSPKNFIHILLNNKVHESVGGQNTAGDIIDFQLLAKANNYSNIYSIENKYEVATVITKAIDDSGPIFIEINVDPGSRNDLGRPTIKPIDNKKAFMRFIHQEY